jgi:hypothetical protein
MKVRDGTGTPQRENGTQDRCFGTSRSGGPRGAVAGDMERDRPDLPGERPITPPNVPPPSR